MLKRTAILEGGQANVKVLVLLISAVPEEGMQHSVGPQKQSEWAVLMFSTSHFADQFSSIPRCRALIIGARAAAIGGPAGARFTRPCYLKTSP